MSGVATAIIGSAVVGGVVASRSASQAAGASRSAARRATEAELYMYDQNRADLAPYREAGYGALDEVQNLFLGSPAERQEAMRNFRTSPGYQFTREQGIEGLTNRASAQGGQLSGNALRGITGFSSGLASGEFNSYVDRLFGIAGLGSGATTTGVQAGQQTASNLSNIYLNEGNARASSYLQGGAGINNAIQGGLQNWAFNTYLNRPTATGTVIGGGR